MQGMYPLPAQEGDRVRYRIVGDTVTGGAAGETGVGTFVLCWFGVTEVYDVRRDDGRVVHVHPELGDRMVKVFP